MPGRTYSSEAYSWGFNGKEKDDEVKGNGNQQDHGMRIYDPRLGKFLSYDPIANGYPELTPYQFASNTPIWAIDLDGLEATVIKKYNDQGKVIAIHINIDIQIINQSENYTQSQVDGYAAAIGNQMTQTFQGNVKYDGVFVPVTSSVNITQADEDSKFTLTFKDVGGDYTAAQKVLGEAAKIGNTQRNNSDIYLGKDQDKMPEIAIAGTHEIGHELGLFHYTFNKRVNLMNRFYNGERNQTNVTSKQLKRIIKKTEKQQDYKQPEPVLENRSIEEIEVGENSQTP